MGEHEVASGQHEVASVSSERGKRWWWSGVRCSCGARFLARAEGEDSTKSLAVAMRKWERHVRRKSRRRPWLPRP